MTCGACGFENPSGMKFCGECAAPLVSQCPSCGCDNPPGFKFCGGCGESLGGRGSRRAALGQPEGSAGASPSRKSPGAYTPKHLADQILQSKSALEGERKQSGTRSSTSCSPRTKFRVVCPSLACWRRHWGALPGGDPQAGRGIVGFSPLLWAEWVLGWMLAEAGRFDECWRHAERARQWAREHGDQEQLASALAFYLCLRLSGRRGSAGAALGPSARESRGRRNRRGVGWLTVRPERRKPQSGNVTPVRSSETFQRRSCNAWSWERRLDVTTTGRPMISPIPCGPKY